MANVDSFEPKFHLLIYTTILVLPTYNLGHHDEALSDEFIDFVNSQNLTWTAYRNFPEDISEASLRQRLGTADDEFASKVLLQHEVLHHRREFIDPLPPNFDTRINWPYCREIIDHIRDQGECASSWGVSVAQAASDRLCIETKGRIRRILSAEDLLSCCKKCKKDKANGCNGGYELEAWKFWVKQGLVTSGDKGCWPTPNFTKLNNHPRPCQRKCYNLKNLLSYMQSKIKGTINYVVPRNNVFQMQMEIMTHGPVTTRLSVFQDFFWYKKGIYRHINGRPMGNKHSVRIIGWGKYPHPYWLVANSWGKEWGDGGCAKIPKGENYLGIEEYVTAGRHIDKINAREYILGSEQNLSWDSAAACLPNVFVILIVILILF